MAVGEAQERARHLLDALATKGDPQTGEATMIFQRLSTILIRLFDLTAPAALADIAQGLSDVSARCTGALAELKPQVDKAVTIAKS